MRGTGRAAAITCGLLAATALLGCGDDDAPDASPADDPATDVVVEDYFGDDDNPAIAGTLAPVQERLVAAGFDVRIGSDFDLNFFDGVPDAVSGLVVTELEDSGSGAVSPPDKFVRIIEYPSVAGARAFVDAAAQEKLTEPYSFIEGGVVYYASAILEDYGRGGPADGGAAQRFLERVHETAVGG